MLFEAMTGTRHDLRSLQALILLLPR